MQFYNYCLNRLEYPSEVEWKNWKEGGKYTKKITITNNSYKLAKICFESIGSLNFKILPTPQPILLAPGNQTSISVLFQPLENVEYNDCMQLSTNFGCFAIFLKASPKVKKELSITTPSSLEFSTTAVHHISSVLFNIENESEIDTKVKLETCCPFSIELETKELGQGDSICLPQPCGNTEDSYTLPAGCLITFEIFFQPEFAKKYKSIAIVSYGEKFNLYKKITLHGKGIYANLSLSKCLDACCAAFPHNPSLNTTVVNDNEENKMPSYEEVCVDFNYARFGTKSFKHIVVSNNSEVGTWFNLDFEFNDQFCNINQNNNSNNNNKKINGNKKTYSNDINKISVQNDSECDNIEKNEDELKTQENKNNNNNCGSYGINDIFKLSRKIGYLEAKTSTKITVTFVPIDITFTYDLQMYVRMHVEGCSIIPRSHCRLVASCLQPKVCFSKCIVRFPRVLVGCESTDNVVLTNQSLEDAFFNFEGVTSEGTFTFSPRCGCIRGGCSVEIKIKFSPVYPIIHNRIVPCIVHNQGVEYIRLLGSSENTMTHPYDIGQTHVTRYEELVANSLSLLSPEQLSAMVDEGEMCFDSSGCLQVLNACLIPSKRFLCLTNERLFFDDANSNAAVVFSTQHFSLSTDLIHFRNTDQADNPFSCVVYVTNHTRGKVDAYWNACDCSPLFSIVPCHQIILAEGTASFNVTYNNKLPSKWHACVFELFLVPLMFADHKKCDERILFSPWSSVITILGNSFKSHCEKLIPRVMIDPCTMELFFPVHLTSSQPLYKTIKITNCGVEPLLWGIRLVEGENTEGNDYSVLSFRPTQGLIAPQCHQIIVIMLENNYCLPEESEDQKLNNENDNNNTEPSIALNENEDADRNVNHNGSEEKNNFESQKKTKNRTEENNNNNSNSNCFSFKKLEVNVSKWLHIRINDDEKNDQIIKCNINYQKPLVIVDNWESTRWKCGASFNGFCEKSEEEEKEETESDCNNCNNIEEISKNVKNFKDTSKRSYQKENLSNMNLSNKNMKEYQKNKNNNNAMVIDSKITNTNNNANCIGNCNIGFMRYIFSRPTNTGNSSKSQSTMINPCLSSLEYRWIIPKKCAKYLKVNPEKDVLKPFELKKSEWLFESVFYEKLNFSVSLEVKFIRPPEEPCNIVTNVECQQNDDDEKSREFNHNVVLYGSRGEIEAVEKQVKLHELVIGESRRSHITNITNNFNCDLHFKLNLKSEVCCCDICGRVVEESNKSNESSSQNDEKVLSLETTSGKLPARTSFPLYGTFKTNERRHYLWSVSYVLCNDEGLPLKHQPETVLFTMSLISVMPTLAFVEVSGDGNAKCLNQDFMMKLCDIANLNKALSKDPKELGIKSEIDVYFPKAPFQSEPSAYVFTVQNTSCVSCHASIEVPSDIEDDMDMWAQTGEITPDQCHKMQVLKNQLFTVFPTELHLCPGHLCLITVSYKHILYGHNKLSLIFKIKQGNKVQLNLNGITLEECAPSLQFSSRDFFFSPTFIGLRTPVTQHFEIYNCSDVPLEYEIDLKPFQKLCKRNFYQPVMECLTPCGRIGAGEITSLIFSFKPLQSKNYWVTTSLLVKASCEKISFSVFGNGVNPCTDLPMVVNSGDPSEIIKSLMVRPEQHCQISANTICLGDCPLKAPVRRILTLQNLFPDECLLFEWHILNSSLKNLVRIEPSSGILPGGCTTSIKVTFMCREPYACLSINVVCQTVKECELAEYMCKEDEWLCRREEIRATVDFCEVPQCYDLNHLLNMEVELSKHKPSEEIKLLRYQTLPPILEPQTVESEKKLRKNVSFNNKKFYKKPEAPKKQLEHLCIKVRSLDGPDFINIYGRDEYNRFFIPDECVFKKEETSECEKSKAAITIKPSEITILTDVLNCYIREAMDNMDECLMCKPDEEPIPFYCQLQREKQKEPPPSYYILTTHGGGVMTSEDPVDTPCVTNIEKNIPNNLFNASHYYDKRFSIVNNIEEEAVEEPEAIPEVKAKDVLDFVKNFPDPINNYRLSKGADEFNEDLMEPVKNFKEKIDEEELDEMLKRKMFYDEIQNKPNVGIIRNLDNEQCEYSTAITNMNQDETSIVSNIDELNEKQEKISTHITNATENEVSKVIENLNINNNKNANSCTTAIGIHEKRLKKSNKNNQRTHKKELSESDIKRMPTFQILLERLVENCLHNVIMESFHNEFNITARPRLAALPPKNQNKSVEDCCDFYPCQDNLQPQNNND